MTFTNQKFKEKQCRTCNSVFTPSNPCNLYCSVECKGRNAYYLRNYGIDEKELERMKESQDNKCSLCGSQGFLIGKKGHHEKLAVDHCHKTGKVRSLLCHNCNRALGLLQDDPDLMERAADYIRMHK